MLKTRAVVMDVPVEKIKVGDKLLQDIVGYKDRVLIYAGSPISQKEIIFLRKLLKREKPTLTAERYMCETKAAGGIRTKDGKVLIKGGEVINEAALAPLLEEGFTKLATHEGGTMFYRQNEWPKDQPWHINDFNPKIRVETITTVEEEAAAAPSASKAPANTKTAGAGARG